MSASVTSRDSRTIGGSVTDINASESEKLVLSQQMTGGAYHQNEGREWGNKLWESLQLNMMYISTNENTLEHN